MSKKKVYITCLFIFILAFFAGNFVYPQYLNISNFPNIPFRLGLDLQGGTHLIYEADVKNLAAEDVDSQMQGLRDVIERRVNLFGVEEPLVQVQKAGEQQRLIVELAGVTDSAEAIEMIGETPYLEFKEQKENYEEIIANNKAILESSEDPDYTKIEDPFQATLLNGKYLKSAELGFDQTTYKALVHIQFDDEGAELFKEITGRNIGKILPIYIDGIPISTPVVEGEISGGKAQISGDFTVDGARELARNLSAGALPVPITLISQQSVGPTLGQISLEQSLRAGMLGLLAVAVFMVIIYRFPGLLASLALVIYTVLNLALFKLIPVTLTLAGIGGFLLSIGMAVDGNILIFSRMKEEMKQGKTFSNSLEEGFKRAWPAIWDGNFTLLIVALILFGLGTSFVKGFAFTLIIGTLLSMFSAITVTKTFLRLFQGTKLENIKFFWR
jgi:protein-export membrane protein SecD